ncbi:hypothetical protein PO909_022372, partial [Leuciscus waleckii]
SHKLQLLVTSEASHSRLLSFRAFYTVHWLEVLVHLCRIKIQGDAACNQGGTLRQQCTNPSVLTSPAMAECPPPIIQSEKFPRECQIPVTQPRYAPPPRVAWDGGGEGEVIVNQACGDLSMEVNGNTVVPPRPLVSPPAPVLRREASYLAQRKTSTSDICYHQFHYKMDNILYESCPKYKFISCPTCRRETVLFTDYGLAALAINTSILSRLPSDPAGAVQWGTDGDRSCYQTVRQYCQSACTCHIANPLSSCGIM